MEHRWGKRRPLDLGVKLHLSSGCVLPGRITNASASGALVRTSARMPAVCRVLVELESADWQEPRTGLIAAHTVREGPGLVALEWAEFSPPLIAALLSRSADTLPGNAKLRPDPNGGRSAFSMRNGVFEQHAGR